MAEFVRVAAKSEIPEGSFKAFDVRHNLIVVVHTSEGFFAFVNECTHDSAPISDGRLKGNEIMCTRHGARFDVKSGAVTAPPAIAPLDTFEVRIDGDDVHVKLA